jgi:hypothetical protein
MGEPVRIRFDLNEMQFSDKDKVADQYIRYHKTKGERITIDGLADLITNIRPPEDDKFIDNYKWTVMCIWQSICVNYNKLYSKPLDAKDGIKVNKFQIEEGKFLKDAPEKLKALHEKLSLLRHDYFVHGGTDRYEEYHLYADAVIYPQQGSIIQINVEGTKEPNLDDADIPVLKELIAHLLKKLEEKIAKTRDRITQVLQKVINDADEKVSKSYLGY